MIDRSSGSLRETSDIVAAALTLGLSTESDVAEQHYWDLVGLLHARGTADVFEVAKALITGSTDRERRLGADMLGQLGWSTPTSFFEESVTLLIAALGDENNSVVSSAAYGLGHRRSARAIEPLLAVANHHSIAVRRGVTHGLSGHNDRRATAALEQLCSDPDSEVRDWASFALGELCLTDYPELRRTLTMLLGDESPEIRGQALIGLARRGDTSCIEQLKSELTGPFNGIWAVHAAAYLAAPDLLPALTSCQARIGEEEQPERFEQDVIEALDACRTSIPKEFR